MKKVEPLWPDMTDEEILDKLKEMYARGDMPDDYQTRWLVGKLSNCFELKRAIMAGPNEPIKPISY